MIRKALPILLAIGAASLQAGSVDSGLLTLIPAGTQTVVGVNAQDARSSELGRFLLQDAHWNDSRLQQVMTQTGFDPRRDLAAIVVATTRAAGAPKSQQPNPTSSVVIARGTFDVAKITSLALQKGNASKQTYNGSDILVMKEGSNGSRAVSFIGGDVAIMGDLQSVQRVIDNQISPTRPDPALETLLTKSADGREVWFASLGTAELVPGMGSDDSASGQHARLLQSIVQSSGGLKLGSSVNLAFDATAKSEKDATSLADVIRFVASAAQLKQDQDPRFNYLAPALQNLNLTTSGKDVHLSTTLPESAVETLVAQMSAATAHRSARNHDSTNRSTTKN